MAESKRYDVDRIKKLMNVIEAWIQSESGPTLMTFHDPKLAVRVKIRGWRKIILERCFDDK